MAIEDDRPPPKRAAHVVGEDVSRLSVAELDERIGLLRAEIARLEAAVAARRSTANAADALFRR